LQELDVGDHDEDNLDADGDDVPQFTPQPPNPADDELEGLFKQREELEDKRDNSDRALGIMYDDFNQYQDKGDMNNVMLVELVIEIRKKEKEVVPELQRLKDAIEDFASDRQAS
jgi:hypothetical protein